MCIRDRVSTQSTWGIRTFLKMAYHKLALITLLVATTLSTDTVSYNECDETWAQDVIYSYDGPGCSKPPGCTKICPMVCWRGQVTICNTTWGSMLTAVATLLARQGLSCGGESSCDPKQLNQYLLDNNGYRYQVIIDWEVIEPLGLKFVEETKKTEVITSSLADGKLAIINTGRGIGVVDELLENAYKLSDTKAGDVEIGLDQVYIAYIFEDTMQNTAQ
eukprot:TRINITY_DN2451_c0_g1_i1.p1 TRINITY_DN2451_c0_g1~~TRINITY_DN2451_c0_g1_i1.p1  ORF type:complete len:219 (-),score=26.24 TRINITY_DN2451_c0_g1_i1:371-1027(-)